MWFIFGDRIVASTNSERIAQAKAERYGLAYLWLAEDSPAYGMAMWELNNPK